MKNTSGYCETAMSQWTKAQNILVIKTVSGMAMAVAAAVDAMKWHEVVGCIAGRRYDHVRDTYRRRYINCYGKDPQDRFKRSTGINYATESSCKKSCIDR